MNPFLTCHRQGQRFRGKGQPVPRQILAWRRTIEAIGGSALVAVVAISAGFLTGCAAYSNNPMASIVGNWEKQPDGSWASATGTQTLSATTGTQAPSAPAAETGAAFASVTASKSVAYRIGAQDVVDVSVFKVPELSKSVQVADVGTINLPLVGEVQVAGKTAQQVERDLTSRLGTKYLQNPQVTVYVKEHNSQSTTVEGAVKKPGVYPIKGKASLLQSLAMAGGLEANSDSTVVVFRYTDGNRTAARFDVDAIRSGQAEDPVLQGGDVVVVGTSAIKETFNNVLKVLPAVGAFALLL
jgi:polysaccharide biosynthesis/export protein